MTDRPDAVAHRFVLIPSALGANPAARLTRRQVEVLRLVGLGRTNDELASELAIEVSTVKRHVRHLMSNLGARDRVALALLAVELQLVAPSWATSKT